MKTLAREFPAPAAPVGGRAQLDDLAAALGCDGLGQLGRKDLGVPIRTARSSWVRRVEARSKSYYIKTYDYPTARARWRGLLRNTGPWRPSRATREARAMSWLAEHGFGAPAVTGAVEWRRFGMLLRAVLVTEAWPGESLDLLLPRLSPADRAAVATELGRQVGELHRLGFRCGNLDLRNVLGRVDRTDDETGHRTGNRAIALAFLDSPRFVLVRPGTADDRRARRDWARLLPQLEPFGLAAIARDAAR